MTVDEVLERVVAAAKKDEWCQECAVIDTQKELRSILRELGKPVPEWIAKNLEWYDENGK